MQGRSSASTGSHRPWFTLEHRSNSSCAAEKPVLLALVCTELSKRPLVLRHGSWQVSHALAWRKRLLSSQPRQHTQLLVGIVLRRQVLPERRLLRLQTLGDGVVAGALVCVVPGAAEVAHFVV